MSARAAAPVELAEEEEAPPTLDELRAEADDLRARIAEREHAQNVEARDRALMFWEQARERARRDLDGLLHRKAVGITDDNQFNASALGDLMAAVSDETDRAMREAINALAERPRIRPPGHDADTRRLGAVTHAIARLEAEERGRARMRRNSTTPTEDE